MIVLYNMGKAPFCGKMGLKKGPWTSEEDQILLNYIEKNGHGCWPVLPKLAGLLRCGKSCRLRWKNYLRPDIKRGSFTQQEERTIIQLHAILGNRWSTITSQLPGRTDNEIKNFWSTRLKKRLLKMGLDPATHSPIAEANGTAADPEGSEALALTRHKAQWENARLEAEARLSRASLLMSSGYHTNYNSKVKTTTMCNDSPPADYFLKMWNSEAGKAFRKENNHPVVLSEIPLSSVSTQNSCGQGQSLNTNDKVKDNGFQVQHCNSSSFQWTGNCNVNTPEELSCFADMSQYNVAEELGFPELLLDFTDNIDDNNNNINSIQSELSAGFQQPPACPWTELHDEDYWFFLTRRPQGSTLT